MYGKRLLTLILAFIAAFFLFMVISFYLYPVFNPLDADDDLPGDFDISEFYEFDYKEFGPAAVLELNKQIAELEEEIERMRLKEEDDIAMIDSLFQANLALEDELARAGAVGGPGGGQLAGAERVVDDKVAEVARSLLRLDEDELRGILNRLSDNQLVQLYESSSNLQREQLLRSLEPAKAATLLRTVLS